MVYFIEYSVHFCQKNDNEKLPALYTLKVAGLLDKVGIIKLKILIIYRILKNRIFIFLPKIIVKLRCVIYSQVP
jgi:hypothetical protein